MIFKAQAAAAVAVVVTLSAALPADARPRTCKQVNVDIMAQMKALNFYNQQLTLAYRQHRPTAALTRIMGQFQHNLDLLTEEQKHCRPG